MSPFQALYAIWLRLTPFDRLVVYTIIFLVVVIGGLRLAGYKS